MRVGIYDHFGWANTVTVSDQFEVVDRRRVELVDSSHTPAPFHYESHKLTVEETAALLSEVHEAIRRTTSTALDQLQAAAPAPIRSLALRTWPHDFPTDVATLRRPPWESRADAVMYRQALAEAARERGWAVTLYSAKDVIGQATALLAGRAGSVLAGPGGRPWTKEHQIALAAAILSA